MLFHVTVDEVRTLGQDSETCLCFMMDYLFRALFKLLWEAVVFSKLFLAATPILPWNHLHSNSFEGGAGVFASMGETFPLRK